MGIIFLLFSLISLKNPSFPGSTFFGLLELPPLLLCIQIVEKFMNMLGTDHRFSSFYHLPCQLPFADGFNHFLYRWSFFLLWWLHWVGRLCSAGGGGGGGGFWGFWFVVFYNFVG
jgi:hypothetical protein